MKMDFTRNVFLDSQFRNTVAIAQVERMFDSSSKPIAFVEIRGTDHSFSVHDITQFHAGNVFLIHQEIPARRSRSHADWTFGKERVNKIHIRPDSIFIRQLRDESWK